MSRGPNARLLDPRPRPGGCPLSRLEAAKRGRPALLGSGPRVRAPTRCSKRLLREGRRSPARDDQSPSIPPCGRAGGARRPRRGSQNPVLRGVGLPEDHAEACSVRRPADPRRKPSDLKRTVGTDPSARATTSCAGVVSSRRRPPSGHQGDQAAQNALSPSFRAPPAGTGRTTAGRRRLFTHSRSRPPRAGSTVPSRRRRRSQSRNGSASAAGTTGQEYIASRWKSQTVK